MTDDPRWPPTPGLAKAVRKLGRDPRDPDPTKTGIFRDHNCAYCRSGDLPCVKGDPYRCEYPHARND